MNFESVLSRDTLIYLLSIMEMVSLAKVPIASNDNNNNNSLSTFALLHLTVDLKTLL